MSNPTPRPRRRSRMPRRLFFLVAGLLSLALATASTGAITMLNYLEGSLRQQQIRELDDREPSGGEEGSELAGQVLNVLLVGSDSREVLSEDEQAVAGDEEDVEGQRSDTLILVHLDPRRNQAVLVHFPRDLRVEIPGHGTDRINTAYNLGGPGLVIRTVKRFTGLRIHHYVEVNFDGFQGLVEALGGVRVCIDRPMVDPLAGLDLDEAKCYTLRGRRALAFVRARHVEGDVIPDFARIGRQQQFIRAVLNKLLTLQSLLRPALIREAAGNVTTDADLSSTDIIYLASQLQELADPGSGASGIDFRVVPAVPQAIDGVEFVIPDEEQSAELFDRLARGKPLKDIGRAASGSAPSTATVRVRVYDAGGDAERVRRRLLLAGFSVGDVEEAPPNLRRSEILLRRNRDEQAEVLAGFFPDVPQRRAARRLFGDADVAIVVGRGSIL